MDSQFITIAPQWIKEMKANPTAFKLSNYRIEETKSVSPGKKRKVDAS